MGATTTLGLDLTPEERTEAIRNLTHGHGVDAVIEASGAPEAIPQGLDMVRDGGRMIVCGHYTDNGAVEIHPHWQLNRKHVELKGCWGSRYDHFHRAVALAARFGDQKPWREMVSGRYTLEQTNEALAAVESRSALKALVTPNPGLVSS
jgi:L-iditol 2-dehydrogenase